MFIVVDVDKTTTNKHIYYRVVVQMKDKCFVNNKFKSKYIEPSYLT